MLLLDLTSCFETSIELSSMLLFLWLCVLLFILTLPIIIIVHKPQMRWTCISDDDWWLGFHLWGSVDQWGHEHLSICVWDVNLVGYASQICIYINMFMLGYEPRCPYNCETIPSSGLFGDCHGLLDGWNIQHFMEGFINVYPIYPNKLSQKWIHLSLICIYLVSGEEAC